MQKKCASCQFRLNARGTHVDQKLVERIKIDVLSTASQICHHPRISDKNQTHLCRGARDFQLQMFYRLGFLEAPIDKAWDIRAKNVK